MDSNKEHGEGRSDVVVWDTINGRVAIFEAKRAMTLGDLESACDCLLYTSNQARRSIQIVDSAGKVFEPVGDFTVKVANADVGDS